MHRISFVQYSDTRRDEISQTFHVSAIRSFFCSSWSLLRYTITPRHWELNCSTRKKSSHNTQSLHNGSWKKVTRHMHGMKKYSNIHAAVWKGAYEQKKVPTIMLSNFHDVSVLFLRYMTFGDIEKSLGKLHSQQRWSLSQTPNSFHFYWKTKKDFWRLKFDPG